MFKLTPFFAVSSICRINLKSFLQLPINAILWQCFKQKKKSRRQLRKWWIMGIAPPRWHNLPINCSSSFGVIFPVRRIESMLSAHAMYLFVWQYNGCRALKLKSHPRMIICSCRAPSVISFGSMLSCCVWLVQHRELGGRLREGRVGLLVPSNSCLRLGGWW